MEKIKLLGFVPRIGAIVLAVILLILGAATIGIIENNDILESARDNPVADFPGNEDAKEFRALVVSTNGASVWQIVLSICVIISVSISMVLSLVIAAGNGKLIIGILEIIGSSIACLMYFSTGISFAVYAAGWGDPPVCKVTGGDDPCDTIPLTATTALQTIFCFIQIAMFGGIIAAAILGIKQSRSEAAAAPN